MSSCNQDKEEWPIPAFYEDEQPHFLFLITPPNSGSTAISEIVNTSNRVMKLHERSEGQWLVPGLCKQDRWNPGKYVDYNSVKAVWLQRYQNNKALMNNADVVIEKSPPNMMRIDKLLLLFHDYSVIANNRNPYAICSSSLYRYYDAKKLQPYERKILLEKIAKEWITRSIKISEIIERHGIPLFTYEEFCSSPASLLDVLNLPVGVAESIDLNAKVKVKDYEPQVIRNQNDRQISRLTDEEINHIRSVLESSGQLLDYFGYKLDYQKM